MKRETKIEEPKKWKGVVIWTKTWYFAVKFFLEFDPFTSSLVCEFSIKENFKIFLIKVITVFEWLFSIWFTFMWLSVFHVYRSILQCSQGIREFNSFAWFYYLPLAIVSVYFGLYTLQITSFFLHIFTWNSI